MVGFEGQRTFDVGRPLPGCLAGESIYQVDADVADAGPAQCVDGPAHLRRVVAAADEAQPGVIERLGPHAHPVDMQPGQCLGQLRGDVVGVALHRHFLGLAGVDGPEQPAQQLGRQLAGGASAEVYRLRSLAEIVASQLNLAAQGVDVSPCGTRVGGRIKPAVYAAAFAKRYVYV